MPLNCDSTSEKTKLWTRRDKIIFNFDFIYSVRTTYFKIRDDNGYHDRYRSQSKLHDSLKLPKYWTIRRMHTFSLLRFIAKVLSTNQFRFAMRTLHEMVENKVEFKITLLIENLF